MEAVVDGYDEGLALDVHGQLSEGSGQNVFVVRDDVLYTPPLASSILAGITRDAVITLARELGFTVVETAIPREALYIADELFVVGTATEVTPVRSVDRIKIGSGSRGPVTERLQRAFFDVINGETPDTHGWLTYVYPEEASLRQPGKAAAARGR
jgi:branched-chain amino acid aminotransferase